MVITMAIDKFYVIENNVVTNLVLYEESEAAKLGLKRYPIVTDLGIVSTNWTYLPKENTFLPPPVDPMVGWIEVRANRNAYLIESDLYVMPDRWATYTEDEKIAWTVYRQTLRDIPQTFSKSSDVVWPKKPWIEEFDNFKPSEPIDPAV